MAFKQFEIEELGAITVYKRSGSRNMRLSMRHDGTVRVTIPYWTPYAAGVAFARSRRRWLLAHAPTAAAPLTSDMPVGKAHRLQFVTITDPAAAPRSRLHGTEITIYIPKELAFDHPRAQSTAKRAAIRALKAEAEQLLPQRLRVLAQKHGFTYASVSVKSLKSRWGSCDQQKNIVLNIFLMQLPWQLIDYVLLHELTHTRVMQHGPKFWAAMEQVLPDVGQIRKDMRTHHPYL
ncbi:MAG TPA: SprT family zinc-dependent metalloprotease [Candidatus Saccharimonadales bacterium]